MQINLPDDTEELSVSAGFSDVAQFIESLVRRERERLALQAGIESMEQGRVETLSEFDRKFRAKWGMEPR